MTGSGQKIADIVVRQILAKGGELSLAGGGRVCSISPITSIVVSNTAIENRDKGFAVKFEGSKVAKRCKNLAALLKYLDAERVFVDGQAELVSIWNRFQTVEEYKEYIDFCDIDMLGLLAKFSDADTFSLTGKYNDGFTIEQPYGIYGISDNLADKALAKIESLTVSNLAKVYDNFSNEEKSTLPNFDKLVQDILKECDDYFESVQKGRISKGQSAYLCDLIESGKTKYTRPSGIWHFYNSLYFWNMQYRKTIIQIKQNDNQRDLNYIFDNPRYVALRECLIDTEVTFAWHCTTSSELCVVYYFAINNASIAWLSQLANDYDMHELEDLAFYKDNKTIFSSCTHEHFHS